MIGRLVLTVIIVDFVLAEDSINSTVAWAQVRQGPTKASTRSGPEGCSMSGRCFPFVRCQALFFLLLGLTACTPYYYDGGGGGGDDDDAEEVGPADLTFGFANQTGYDFTNGAIAMSGPGGTGSFEFGAIPDGDSAVDSTILEDALYGEVILIAARAVDIDGDCYDWPDEGSVREYEIGPTIDINIVFTFDLWLGGGCP